MSGAIATGAGFWDPLAMLIALLAMAAVALLIRSAGRKGRPRQSETFYSGSPAPADTMKGSNFYWGFFEALGRYYRLLMRMHTGMPGDYLFIYVLVMVVMAIALIGGALWA